MDSAARLIAEGNRAEHEGRVADACALYRRAIGLEPRHVPAHLNLGAALEASGDLAGAEQAYRAVLAFDAGNAFANYNLANVARARADVRGAADLLRSALRAKPDFPDAHVALANALDALGELEQAAEHLERAVEQRPQYAGAWHNYGLVLRRLQRLEAAEAALRRSLELEPGSAASSAALGALLRTQGRITEALATFAAARRRSPQAIELEAGELFTLLFSEELGDAELFERHRAFGARIDAALGLRLPHANTREPERALRIGYVSADLNRHPVALFLLPVLARRQRSEFHVTCYHTGTLRDEVSYELKALSDAWLEAAHLDDARLAERIRADRIDILVDLTGHAGPPRLGMFARQPAPVQASWLGYLHSLGSRAIQYRLCDAYTDVPGYAERLHTETLMRLPGSQWCYRPFLTVAAASEPPCARSGAVTFGSFNHASKISPGTRKAWREILARRPDARLMVLGVGEGRAAQQLLEDLGAPGRVTLGTRLPLDAYLAKYNEVDIALDTAPYSGGTTTCDALWMGVPVASAPGTRSISRSSASLLLSAGLADWIAPSFEEYAEFAVRKSEDVALLKELRATLRERMRDCALMDEARFTRNLESAYRTMWRAWCGS